jgi:X-X-X-Leu-X-X-Gly heptad repeat protein
MLSLPVSAAQMDNRISKEENIYASLRSDGSFKNAYVVNSFLLKEPGQIEDYGEYDTLVNLTTMDALQANGGKVSINAPAGKFYYQGNTSNIELPWLFKIKYLLDGKEVDAVHLSGAEGLLEIHIEIRKNPKGQDSFADHYTVQTMVTLDGELCSEIDAKGAAIANAGRNKVVTFTMLPGSEGDYSLSANVSDFKMEGIQISALPVSMNIEIPDTSLFADELAQLTQGMVQLDDGVRELDLGVKELNNGARQLKNGMEALQPGIAGITEGLQALEVQGASLTNGSEEILNGMTEIMNSLPEQLAQLKGALAQLVESYKGFNGGLQAYTGGVSQISNNCVMINEGYQGLMQGANSLSSGISELKDGTGRLAEGTGQLRRGTSSIDSEVDAAVDKLLESFAGGHFEPVSYMSPKNKDVEYVQFILMTDGVEALVHDVPEKKEEKKLTFWDRLLALFGF